MFRARPCPFVAARTIALLGSARASAASVALGLSALSRRASGAVEHREGNPVWIDRNGHLISARKRLRRNTDSSTQLVSFFDVGPNISHASSTQPFASEQLARPVRQCYRRTVARPMARSLKQYDTHPLPR